MNQYHYFLISIASISCISYAMEQQSKSSERHEPRVIENLSTRMFVPSIGSWQEIFSLLRYPDDQFKKTQIINIVTHSLDDLQKPNDGDDFWVPKKEAIKQGMLDTLTEENLAAIKSGFSTYHYGIKSSSKNSNVMDIGALVIDKNVFWRQKKVPLYLEAERNLICMMAIDKKIKKRQGNIIEKS